MNKGNKIMLLKNQSYDGKLMNDVSMVCAF